MHWYMKENPVPKGMPKREQEALLVELRELLRTAKMEACNFDGSQRAEFDPKNKTAFIKAETEGWRWAYLIQPLSRLVARYEGGPTPAAPDTPKAERCVSCNHLLALGATRCDLCGVPVS